jgi:cation diffusion facilitator family transporter
VAGSEHGTKAVIAALFANLGIAIAKFVGFLLTSSASMLAESVHSMADSGNQGLLLLGGRRAQRDVTPEHPFGFGRERYFWSFVVALVLFSMGGLFAVYEGVEKIRHPHEMDSPTIALSILALAIAIETWSFRTAVVEGRKVKASGTTWWRFIRQSKSPELPVVLLEDLGALVGLVVAFTAVGASVVTDNHIYDGIGTLSIGVLLVVIAMVLAVEMKGLLIGEAASRSDQKAIADTVEGDEAVDRLIHMRTQHLGPDELLVAAKIELAGDLTADEVADVIDRVETNVRRAVPTARLIYLEPDVYRGQPVGGSDSSDEEQAAATQPSD